MTSADVGKDTERRVARYLRENGWPSAERRIKTAYRVGDREVADEGDLIGCIGICWQVKSLRPANRMELAVPTWLAETEHQRRASGATLGFVVVRRWGTEDVGRWWTFQRLSQLADLATISLGLNNYEPEFYGPRIPVRMDMAALVGLLHQTGWAGTTSQEATP